jgi:hypothetical protein
MTIFGFKVNFNFNFNFKVIRCAHWAAAQTASRVHQGLHP